MAHDATLARRIRDLLTSKEGYTEKKMFGGIAFLHDGRMCCGVLRDALVARSSIADKQSPLRKTTKRNTNTYPLVRPLEFPTHP